MLGFHSFLRMGSTEFNEILEEIAEDIMRMDTVMRDSVTPKERLVVTLRYLASGKPCNVQMLVILMTINVYVSVIGCSTGRLDRPVGCSVYTLRQSGRRSDEIKHV